jgi:hypothetical protein
MRESRAVTGFLFAVLMCASAGDCKAQVQPSSAPPHSAGKPTGFFDYALGKINPDGKDYGSTMQAARDGVVDHSVDDLYFWSNAVTLLLLCGTAALILLQWRSSEKREVIAASLIAELWNGRVSDRIELERRTGDFNRLVAKHNIEVERALSSRGSPTEKEKEAAESLDRNIRRVTAKVAKPTGTERDVEPTPADPATTAPVDSTSASLKQSNLLLQRQVEAMQNSEQNLKQRLNQTTLLLDQERRRNSSLKGA